MAPDDDVDDRVRRQIDALFDKLDEQLKNIEVQHVLAERRVNASIAMLAADGLRAYLQGDRERAIEDLSTAAEEMSQRYRQGAKGDA